VSPRLLLHAAELHPATFDVTPIVGYLVRTKDQARRLIWGRLQALVQRLGLPVSFNHTTLTARHANGCEIWVLGADKETDIEKLRGFAYVLIVVDEAQSLPAHFRTLVTEVLGPALTDYKGTLLLLGTPNAARAGYFYEACKGRYSHQYHVHHWTVRDNIYFPRWAGATPEEAVVQAEKMLAEIREDEGWAPDDPAYLREWEGLWIRDGAGLVYRYDPDRDDYDTLPDGHSWRHVIGGDLGYDDAFALVTWAFCDDLPDLYEVDAYSRSGLIPAQWAEVLRERDERFSPVATVLDTGALGKAIAIEFKMRYHLQVKPAEKSSKMDFITLMNSDYQRGRIHLLRGGITAAEVALLPWAPQRDERARRDEDPEYANHLCDAHLYGWREAKHWLHEPPPVEPVKGSPEYWAREEKEMWDEVAHEDEEDWS
jgi:hypothetical protein